METEVLAQLPPIESSQDEAMVQETDQVMQGEAAEHEAQSAPDSKTPKAHQPDDARFLSWVESTLKPLTATSDGKAAAIHPQLTAMLNHDLPKVLKEVAEFEDDSLRRLVAIYLPALVDWEELKYWVIICFGGGLFYRQVMLQTILQKLDQTHALLDQLLNPKHRRDAIRSRLERWLEQHKNLSLEHQVMHPNGVSPKSLLDDYFRFDLNRTEREARDFLKNYYNTKITETQAELLKSGAEPGQIVRAINQLHQTLEKRKDEHFITYKKVKQLEILKERVARYFFRYQEHLARLFVMILPEDTFAVRNKLRLERLAHSQKVDKLGEQNDLQGHENLLKAFNRMENGQLIKQLVQFQENKALLNQASVKDLINVLSEHFKQSFSEEQLKLEPGKVLNDLLLMLAESNLSRRTFQHNLAQCLQSKSLNLRKSLRDTVELTAFFRNYIQLMVQLFYNPFVDLYYQLKKASVLDWCVHKLADLDKQEKNNACSTLKAVVYQQHELEIYTPKGERNPKAFFEALEDPERCHTTAVRNMEMTSLERLSEIRFIQVFEALRERVREHSAQVVEEEPAVQCFSLPEEWDSLVSAYIENLKLAANDPQWADAFTPPAAVMIPLLEKALQRMKTHHQEHRARIVEEERDAANQLRSEAGLMAADDDPPGEAFTPLPTPETAGIKLNTLVPEMPSFRNKFENQQDTRAVPMPQQMKEIEERLFIRNNVNYFPEFQQVTEHLFEFYKADLIHMDCWYRHDAFHADKNYFKEKVVYFIIDENHVVAIGKSMLYMDPTLSQNDLTAYPRLFVRNKFYQEVPREGGHAKFKNMVGISEQTNLCLFEEISPGQYKRTNTVDFLVLFKECLLCVIESLPEKAWQTRETQNFLEYLIPDHPQKPAISPALMEMIEKAGLADRLPLPEVTDLMKDRVNKNVQNVYRVLKSANAPIFKARKHKLDEKNLNDFKKEEILNRINQEDKVRLYRLALVLELYLNLRKQFSLINQQHLFQIAGHFYQYKPESLPEGVKAFLIAHMELFDKRMPNEP